MAKANSNKKALLSSLFALLICVAMLIGTTFAWFTDTAKATVSRIQSGTLDVALEMKDSEGNWVSAEGETLNFVKAPGAEAEEILWEPGVTYALPELRIVNKGNLALKYKIAIAGAKDATPDDDKNDLKLLDVIDWTYEVDGTSYALESEKHLAAQKGDEESFDTFTVKGHMQETANNDYQGLSIDSIAITVVATQDTVEHDSYGNQYDANAQYPDTWDGSINEDVDFTDGTATVSTAADFAGAAKKATENKNGDIQINLENSLVMNAANWEPIKVDGYHGAGVLTIDGKGNTISGLNAPLVFGGFAGNSGIVIKNLTIADSNISVLGAQGVGAFIANVDSMTTITLENCRLVNSTVSGERVGGLIGWTSGYNNQNDGPVDTTVTVNNCSVVDSTVNASKSAGAIIGHAGANPATYHFITNCKVENVTLNGEYKGLLIGTANAGQVTADNNTLSGNVTNFVGRYALGNTGKVTINGKQYTQE